MKNTILLVVGCFGLLISKAQTNEFRLEGNLAGKEYGLLYLYYSDIHNERVRDSSRLENGQFRFTGQINGPTMAYLMLKEEKSNQQNSTNFFLEPKDMGIQLSYNDFKNNRIRGSQTQAEYEKLNKLKEPVIKEMEPLSKLYSEKSEEYRNAVKKKMPENYLDSFKNALNDMHDRFDPYTERMAKIDYAFFAQNPGSFITAYELRFQVSRLPLDSLQLFYGRLGTSIQSTPAGKEIGEEIRKLAAGNPGSMAKDFKTTDINGKELTLSMFQGKYVLLDFWASWCVPCRKGNPHLKELYALYHDKGFEIIGISDDDRDHDAWKNAVSHDGLPWKHILRGLQVINGQYDRSKDISDGFGIHSLPTALLIDASGKIIGRYGEGLDDRKKMDEQLAKAFGMGLGK